MQSGAHVHPCKAVNSPCSMKTEVLWTFHWKLYAKPGKWYLYKICSLQSLNQTEPTLKLCHSVLHHHHQTPDEGIYLEDFHPSVRLVEEQHLTGTLGVGLCFNFILLYIDRKLKNVYTTEGSHGREEGNKLVINLFFHRAISHLVSSRCDLLLIGC